jgi:diguanylate cyclase (GGDEF)-like protein
VSDDWDETALVLPGDLDTAQGAAQAYLVVIRGKNIGESFPVIGPTMVIGRGSGADLRLNDEGVSRFHCKLHQQQNAVLVEDLGSRNGTYCNGERILPGLRTLVEGDRLQIGTAMVLRFTYVETTGMAPVIEPPSEPHDVVTGTLSRRQFMEVLETEIAAALARKTPLSLVLVHIDRSEQIIAEQGQAGLDELAAVLAKKIRDNVRKDDALGRIGPADFALASLRASPGDTFMFAERMRKSAPAGGNSMKITISVGIASISELNIDSAHDLLIAAANALHRARSQGGDRTVLCTPDLLREPKSRGGV